MRIRSQNFSNSKYTCNRAQVLDCERFRYFKDDRFILTDLLHNAESEKLHELYKILKRASRLLIVFRGVKWTVRMLRWLLVVDIEIEEISHLKKCFLIALPRQEFYLEQMRIALVQLSDKILTFIQISDLSLLVSFEKSKVMFY